MPISSTVERMILLKRVLLFDSLPAERLRALAGICTERLYAPDAVIFRKGDPGDELFVVVEGEVRVGLFEHEQADAEAERPPTAPGSAFITLAIYGPGSVFGEMTVFNNARRSATAIASGETFLLALRDEALRALLYQQPDIAIELLGTFSDRLRAANERIEALSASG
jgi:CRP/FNR family transcriptional regulator